jgi:hypothetical protein
MVAERPSNRPVATMPIHVINNNPSCCYHNQIWRPARGAIIDHDTHIPGYAT